MTDTSMFDPLTMDEAEELSIFLSVASKDEFAIADHLHHLCMEQSILSPSWRALDHLARVYASLIADMCELLHDLSDGMDLRIARNHGKAGMT